VSAPKNHHYVPQFYLEPWCGNDGLVASYYWRRDAVACGRISRKRIGSELHLYSYRNPNTPDPQWAETEFYTKKVDTPAAPVRDKMLAGKVDELTLTERENWARFVSSLVARRADILNSQRVRAPISFAELCVENPPATNPNLSKEEVLKVLNDKSPGAAEDFALSVSLLFVEGDQIYLPLLNLKWGCLDVSGSGAELMTCDDPLTRIAAEGPAMDFLLMPMSPHHLFYAAKDHFQSVKHYYDEHGPRFVDLQNRNNIERARRFVVARECGKEDYVRRYFRRPT
jgi:hypothetical protein